MYRLAQKHLSEWFNSRDRPVMILRGARQVGKSTLVRNFAKSEKLDLIEINLELRKLKSLQGESLEIDKVLLEIEGISKKKITPNTLIFLDEIQEDKKALKFLRYFYELKPELAVITAGSLLEFAVSENKSGDEDFSFPVGRVAFYHLGPMSFSEFLLALGEKTLFDLLKQSRFEESLHDRFIDLLQQFYFIGGMPKAIATYVTTRSNISVRDVHQSIYQAYLADFPRYGKRINTDRLKKVLENSVGQIGKKVIYQNIDSHSKSREVSTSLDLLKMAKILLHCYHSDGGAIPLKSFEDEKIFKLYFLDIGLFNSIYGLDWNVLTKDFKDHLSTKGTIAEQFIAQHLAYLSCGKFEPHLNYWLRDKSSAKAEIDFLLEFKSKIIPIEVKSEKGGRLQSLMVFAKEKKKTIGVRFSLDALHNSKLEAGKVEVMNIPLYMVESLNVLLESGFKE